MTRAGDWNPADYARFRDLRLRPAHDLIARIPPLPDGAMFDLGCGNGAAAGALRARFAGRWLCGIDASPAMAGAARATGDYDAVELGDLRDWSPARPAALLFSNAALHWIDDHAALFRRLAGQLVAGGTLAVQMPRQQGAPSHRFLREFATEMFPDRFSPDGWRPPVAAPVEYHRMLSPLGDVSVWQTDYVQRLEPAEAGHPVRHFTEATVMRPILDRLASDEAEALIRRYEGALAAAYPPEPDGSVLFPFRRLFICLTV